MTKWVAAFVLLFSLAAPLIAAQSLPLEPCGPLSGRVEVPPPLAPGEQGKLLLRIDNDGDVAAVVRAAMQVSEPGWTFDKADQTATIDAGGHYTFSFVISPGADATGPATANFIADGDCRPNTTIPNCPQNACTAQGVAFSQVVAYRPAPGVDVPFLRDLNFRPEYLVAGLVLVSLVAAIPLLARRPSRAVEVDTPEPLKSVTAGRGVSFPVMITNPGREPATITLEVGLVPGGWTAFMPLPDLQLAPQEERELFLMVRAPETALAGDSAEIELVIRDPARPGHERIRRVRAEVMA